MTDTIFIKKLTIDTIIGIYDWEKNTRQDIILDIEMSTDVKKAAQSDNIKDALNYKAISKRLITFVQASRFELVETLAERICELILSEFNVKSVKLTLNKGKALTGAEGVGVIIKRCQA